MDARRRRRGSIIQPTPTRGFDHGIDEQPTRQPFEVGVGQVMLDEIEPGDITTVDPGDAEGQRSVANGGDFGGRGAVRTSKRMGMRRSLSVASRARRPGIRSVQPRDILLFNAL